MREVLRYQYADEATMMAALDAAGMLEYDYETDPETGEQVAVGDPYLPAGSKGAGFDLVILGRIPDVANAVTVEVDGLLETSVPFFDGYHLDVLLTDSSLDLTHLGTPLDVSAPYHVM